MSPQSRCPFLENWDDHQDAFSKISKQIEDNTAVMNLLLSNTAHLKKLDALEDIRDNLLDSATGRNHLETKTAVLMLKILGAVIATLLLIILFLLTGQHLNIFSLFKPV